MVSEVITGISLFKSMMDMARGLKDINDAAIRNGAVIELQNKILAAQEQQAALIERISHLESEVARFNSWEAERERYALRDFGGGRFAYALKSGMERGDPPHRLCPACFNERRKGLLQSRGNSMFGGEIVFCASCKSQFELGEKTAAATSSARETDSEYF